MTSFTASAGAAEAGPSPRHPGERLPRSSRVRRTREIRRVLRDGRRFRGKLVDLYAAASEHNRARVGVIVPRFGRSAVARNRVRRRLREIARRDWLPLAHRTGTDLDVVLKARPAIYESSFEQLRGALLSNFESLCSED